MINQDYKQSQALKKEIHEFELSIFAGEKYEQFDMLADVAPDKIQLNKNNNKARQRDAGKKYAEGHMDANYRDKLKDEDKKVHRRGDT